MRLVWRPFWLKEKGFHAVNVRKCKIEGGLFGVTLGGRARRRRTAWRIKLCRALLKDQGSQDLDRR
jgi:hypothetical protein